MWCIHVHLAAGLIRILSHLKHFSVYRPTYYCTSYWSFSWENLRLNVKNDITRMWANAQRDGRPAEYRWRYRWRPLFNASTGVPCSNAAKTQNPLKFAGVPQTTGSISAASGPKFTILWEHVEEILLLNNFFPIVYTCLSCEDIAQQSCTMVPRWRFLTTFCVLYLQRAPCSTFQNCI